MKFLFDFFPILIFFIVYKLHGIYWATGSAIIVSVLQILYMWIKHRRVEKMALMSMLLIVILGGATLILHNPWFVKWKPTVIYWLFASVFFASRFSEKCLVERMMGAQLSLPPARWKIVNRWWVEFFALMGTLNLYIIYHFNTNTWVNFKLFGILGATIIFVFIQAFYLARNVPSDTKYTYRKSKREI